MSDALRFEWVRLRTLRSTYWLIFWGLLLSATVALLLALGTRHDPRTDQVVVDVTSGGGAGLPLPVLGVFMAVLGILAMGHEYRYGTIQPTLTALPRRITVLAAKAVVTANPDLLK